ncbi:MAG TPA: acetate/propionate family kinase [Chloroflexia bacterium]|nr:acetate/propionate family kinase [Chloroflexia bacterium]
MKILVLNSGSSSLKFDVMSVDFGGDRPPAVSRLASGAVSRIGDDDEYADVRFTLASPVQSGAPARWEEREVAGVRDHRDAVAQVFAWLDTVPSVDGDGTLQSAIDAVGHRVVAGGERFIAPALIEGDVLDALDDIGEIAPLHNPPAVLCIRAAGEELGPSIPQVAVFDTSFHATLPDYAYTYAIPRELTERHNIRRYGFHGTAHEYMLERYAQLADVPREQATIVTLQLGNGCSATAIRNGRSVDTSMGFTPLEGLVMGTRSGDIDAGLVSYLGDKENIPISEIDDVLNQKSGLLGMSGRSGDMRDLLSVEAEDEHARLAVEVFVYRVRKYIGAYLAALGGAQAVVFGGGIGENGAGIRARICDGMEWCGLRLDPGRNEAVVGMDGRISAEGAEVEAYVIKVDESALIARYTAEYVSKNAQTSGSPS